MVDDTPIVARIVIDDSGIKGLGTSGGGSQTGKSNETNKLLREVVRLLGLQNAVSKLGLLGKVGDLLTKAGSSAVAGGVIAGTAVGGGISGMSYIVGEGLANQDPNTGEFTGAANISIEESEAIAKSLGIQREDVEKQAQVVHDTVTITTDTRSAQEKVQDEWFRTHEAVKDTADGTLKIKEKTDDVKSEIINLDQPFKELKTNVGYAANGLRAIGDAAFGKAEQINNMVINIPSTKSIITAAGYDYESVRAGKLTTQETLGLIDLAASSEVEP